MADILSNFAQSDAYLSALMREVRSEPATNASLTNASLTMGRRTFFKLAGAGAAGLVLGFQLGDQAFAAETADGKDQTVPKGMEPNLSTQPPACVSATT